MGNLCLYYFRKCFKSEEIQSLTEMPTASENYHQVQHEENLVQFTDEQIQLVPDCANIAEQQSIDMFLFRLKTVSEMEVVINEDRLKIEFKSYQLNKFTIVQLRYEFIANCSIRDFLEYQFLDYMESIVRGQITQVQFAKIKFLEPRKYCYVKVEKQQNKHYQVFRSVQGEENNGRIFISGFAIEQKENLHIQGYSEIDFRVTYPAGMIKKPLCLELKKAISRIA